MNFTTGVAAGASVVTTAVSLLTYRQVRRVNRGAGWSVAVDTKPGLGTPERKFVVITRTHGPAAKNVTVSFGPPGTAFVMGSSGIAETESMPALDPGGHLRMEVVASWLAPNANSIVVTWDGLFGRRRAWRSGL